MAGNKKCHKFLPENGGQDNGGGGTLKRKGVCGGRFRLGRPSQPNNIAEMLRKVTGRRVNSNFFMGRNLLYLYKNTQADNFMVY